MIVLGCNAQERKEKNDSGDEGRGTVLIIWWKKLDILRIRDEERKTRNSSQGKEYRVLMIGLKLISVLRIQRSNLSD